MLNYQMQFNGYTIGAYTDVQLALLKGFRGLPAIRGGDVQKGGRDGSFPGLMLLDERIAEIDMQVWANAIPSGSTVEQVLTELADAFNIIEDPSIQLPLSVQLPGWTEPRVMFCRPSNYDLDVDSDYNFNTPKPAVQLTANDPLIYSSTIRSAATGLPTPTAGLTFPVTFPVSFGSSTGGGTSVINAGNYTSPFVCTITGPVTNPTLSIGDYTFGLTITLGVTDTIVIDMGARTVTLNGTAPRNNTVDTGSSWLGIPPGTSSIGVSSSDSTAVAANFSFAWRDAWGNL